MRLTTEEQRMLDGKLGEAVQQSMELLVAVGESYGAERMVPITSAHLSAANPVSAGVGGTAYIRKLAETGKFIVTTTTNPGSHPLEWRTMGFGEQVHREQTALSDAITRMGGFACNTCTPYLIGHCPRKGEHVTWCESSAILYANSVLGSRTNREAGPTAMASAITGRTPAWGYHLDENRRAKLKIRVTAKLKNYTDYSTLGYFAGKIAQDRVPMITDMDISTNQDELKCLGASLATSGMVSLYHAVGLTPEAPDEETACAHQKIGSSDIIEFSDKDLDMTEKSLCATPLGQVNLVVLGCPNPSISQIKKYATILQGRKIKDHVDVWIQTGHAMLAYAENLGLAGIIKSSGARFVTNSCAAVMPQKFFKKKGYRAVATDAGKLVYYISTTKGVPCYYGSLEKFVDVISVRK